jgi:integrase/ribosomal protein L40E
MGEFGIHRCQSDIDAAYRRLDEDRGVCAKNRELIHAFARERLAKGVGNLRMAKCVYCLRYLARWNKTPFEDATKESVLGLVVAINSKELSPASKSDFRAVLKLFFKWYKGNDETYPPEVSWIKTTFKKQHKLPEELLTEEEVFRIAKAADNPRDRALVLVLYETGCRIGEIMSLRVKHVLFDQYGAVLRVTGKTGDRRVRVISSAPALSAWVQIHAKADNPEAPLWPPLSTNKKYHMNIMEYQCVHKLLQVLAARAGIKKRVYPHLFRHSRATALASKLTEAQMKEYFGWVQASYMASVYVHLSGRDVDDALLALQGLKKPDTKVEEALKLRLCPRCQEKNSPIAKFCLRCGTPMEMQAAIQIEEEKKVGDELLNKLMQNPEFKEFLFKKAVELGLDRKLA